MRSLAESTMASFTLQGKAGQAESHPIFQLQHKSWRTVGSLPWCPNMPITAECQPFTAQLTTNHYRQHSLDSVPQVLCLLSQLLHPGLSLGRRTLSSSCTTSRLLPPGLELSCCLRQPAGTIVDI